MSAATISQPQAYGKVATPIAAQSVIDLIKNRRTYYPLSKELTIGKDRIQQIVKDALLHVPSAFNSQPNRVVVLFDGEHDSFWDMTTELLRAKVPADQWQHTGDRMAMFKGAAGTIMFFEDKDVVDAMAQKFPSYADKFPVWSLQSLGMVQFSLWTALEAEGLGANLQHYNPVVDANVTEHWKLPASWKLNAQLVFGGRTAAPGDKTFVPLEDRYRVYGA